MLIQINADKNIERDEKLDNYLTSLIEKGLSKHSSHITRVEAHLTDDNAQKKAENDKRCVLEARVQNKQPIAVTGQGNTVNESVNDALKKLEASLNTMIGRLRNR